jgi:hypothetical protein
MVDLPAGAQPMVAGSPAGGVKLGDAHNCGNPFVSTKRVFMVVYFCKRFYTSGYLLSASAYILLFCKRFYTSGYCFHGCTSISLSSYFASAFIHLGIVFMVVRVFHCLLILQALL